MNTISISVKMMIKMCSCTTNITHIIQPAHIRLPGKFAPDKKFQSQPAPASKVVHWGDEDQGEGYALDIINNMGNVGGAGAHFDHHLNTDGDSIHSSNHSHSTSNYSNNSSTAKFRPSAQQKLLANGYGKNAQGNFFNITKRKSMGDHRKKAKRRMSRSRTFVSNTNGKKYNVFEQKKNKNQSHLNATNANNYDEEKSHQPIIPSPKQSPLMVPSETSNNNNNNVPRSAPQHAISPPRNNVPHQITLDDFELEHQLDGMNNAYNNHSNHNRASNVHKHNGAVPNNKPGHQQYYSTHINISQRNSMIPAASPTMHNHQSETVAKEWNRKRSKNKLSGLKQNGYVNNSNSNHNNGNKRKSQHINVHFSNLEQVGISKSAPAPDPSQHRNLGSLTHTELKGFLEADNLFNYNGYNNPNIVQ